MVGDNPRCEDTLRFHVFSDAVCALCALWLAHEPAQLIRFRTQSLRVVHHFCCVFSSHEETSEIPLSSSTVLRRHHYRQRSRNTHYQAGAAPYLGRTSTGWIT